MDRNEEKQREKSREVKKVTKSRDGVIGDGIGKVARRS